MAGINWKSEEEIQRFDRALTLVQGLVNRYGTLDEQKAFLDAIAIASVLRLDVITAQWQAEEAASNLRLAQGELAEARTNGMPENLFRNVLDDILSLVEEHSTDLESIEPTQLFNVVEQTFTDDAYKPYYAWYKQWERGDYPSYLMNLKLKGT